MEGAANVKPPRLTRAEYRAEAARSFAEMDRLHESIIRDLEEIDRLRAETVAILAELRGG